MNEAFQPDWLSPPGATIAALLKRKKVSVRQLASVLNCSQEHAKALLSGRAVITGEIAKSLALNFGGAADFWVAREEQFREGIARLQRNGRGTASRLWLNELPISDMIKFGWIEAGNTVDSKVKSSLEFFDVSDVSVWRQRYSEVLSVVSFRTSLTYRSEPGAVLAWLRQGELLSEKIKCKQWNLPEFKKQLDSIKKLTHIKDVGRFLPILQKICAECGVALVIARAPSGCRASGATRFLSETKAMILLSFRYLTDDHFWFTFFHEAAHLILHSKNAIFIEDGSEVTEREESEANQFAADYLISPLYRKKMSQHKIGQNEILRTAAKFGISRGITVGQFQHSRLIEAEKFNWMKRRYKWSEIEPVISPGKK